MKKRIIKFALILISIFVTSTITTLHASVSNKSNIINTISEGLENRNTQINIQKYKVSVNDANELAALIGRSASIGSRTWSVKTDNNYGIVPDTSGKVDHITVSYTNTASDSNNRITLFNNKVDSIIQNIRNNMSELEKVKYIHDYLVKNCTYNNTYGDDAFNAYGCIINKKAACQGYSTAFSELCEKVGIQTVIVGSDSMNHAWNKVCIDKNWYHVDVTWDSSMYRLGKNMYEYFLISDSKISKNVYQPHSGWTVLTYETDPVTDSEYNMANWNVVHPIGDYDFNGIIDITDLSLVQIATMNNVPNSKIKYADVNSDGIVNILDVATLKRKIIYG